jgi:predicted TIM-barrel fold metal-dependent hydrolase
MKDFAEAGFKPEVHPLILKENAMRLLKLTPKASPAA